MTGSRLAALLDQATPGPWDWFGGYPQRVTNPAATLVAEVFDDPDTPASTVRLIALAPDMARLLADTFAEHWEDIDPELRAQFAALDEKAGGA